MSRINRKMGGAAKSARLARKALLYAALLTLGTLGAPGIGHAVLIDGFGTPHAGLEDFPGPSVVASSVSGPDIVGGERDAQVGSTTLPGITGATRFQATAGLGVFSADPFGDGQTRLDYDGPGSPFDGTSTIRMDFTDGGVSDRFIIEVAALSGATQVLFMAGPAGVVESLQSDWIDLTAGRVEVPFSSFHLVGGPSPGQSFQAAAQLMVAFRVLDGAQADIDAICSGAAGGRCTASAIPAPPTWPLVVAGLGALGLSSRLRSRARGRP